MDDHSEQDREQLEAVALGWALALVRAEADCTQPQFDAAYAEFQLAVHRWGEPELLAGTLTQHRAEAHFEGLAEQLAQADPEAVPTLATVLAAIGAQAPTRKLRLTTCAREVAESLAARRPGSRYEIEASRLRSLERRLSRRMPPRRGGCRKAPAARRPKGASRRSSVLSGSSGDDASGSSAPSDLAGRRICDRPGCGQPIPEQINGRKVRSDRRTCSDACRVALHEAKSRPTLAPVSVPVIEHSDPYRVFELGRPSLDDLREQARHGCGCASALPDDFGDCLLCGRHVCGRAAPPIDPQVAWLLAEVARETRPSVRHSYSPRWRGERGERVAVAA